MGIRFFCDACNRKLNVKSFLAGRRGVCPHCDAKIQIPLESQRESTKDQPAATASVPSGSVATETNVATRPASTSAAGNGASSPTTANGKTALPVSPAPVAATPVAAPTPVASAPVSTPAPAAVAAAQPVAKVTAVAPAAPPSSNPLDEAPNAHWYVRPPSGGQFGPARADVMQRWIGEGRVNSECLVWREGWQDWQSASTILSPTQGIGGPPPAPGGQGQADRASSAYRAKRRNSNTLAAIAVVMLVVLAAVCLGVLIYVLSSKERNTAQQTLPPPPTTTLPAPLHI